jgi:hypothetical protein
MGIIRDFSLIFIIIAIINVMELLQDPTFIRCIFLNTHECPFFDVLTVIPLAHPNIISLF